MGEAHRFLPPAGALVAVGALTALLAATGAHFEVASLLLVVLVVLASWFGYLTGAVAAVASYLSLNFFFTYPEHSLRITKLDDLLPLLAFSVAVVVLGATVARMNALRRQAVTRERAIRDARTVAAVEESRAGFLSAMTHNLRTPLGGIKAVVSTLRAPDVHLSGVEETELLDVAYDEIDRLERLVTKVLELSRIRAGVLEVHHEVVDVGDLVREAVRRLRHMTPEHDIQLDLGPAVPLVSADPAMMELVMVSLLENAVHFAPPRTPIAVRVEATGADSRAAGVAIRVVDHGPGVAPDERERIFEAFVQGRGKTDGTGLGLAIARSFVDAHGGRLDVEETPGGGATFVVDIPERPAR